MKISKVAASTARRLFGLCQSGGRLDDSKLRTVVSRLVEAKPRDYRAVLAALHKLTRLELEKRAVTVESAVDLDEGTRQRVLAGHEGSQLRIGEFEEEHPLSPPLLKLNASASVQLSVDVRQKRDPGGRSRAMPAPIPTR